MIILKTPEEIRIMKEGGKILAKVLMELGDFIRAGITSWAINKKAEDLIRKLGGKPAFKGYKPRFSTKKYPYATCISINDEIVHGLPSKSRVLEEGDIVSVDIGVFYKGYYTDGAYTYIVGNVDGSVRKLVEVTKEALYKGIEKAVAGNRVGDIGHAVESYVKKFGFSPVKDFCGHGIGKNIHEDPSIPNEGRPGTGPILEEGMTVAIEPMISMGSGEVSISENGWTAVTKDGSLAAHFEHTVAIFKDGCEILTDWERNA